MQYTNFILLQAAYVSVIYNQFIQNVGLVIRNVCLVILKNGIYIHFIHLLLHYWTQNMYLSSAITFKLYSINYFYWYGHLYHYLPNPRHNWVKHFVRFTDTGHLASFVVLVYPTMLPIAHNIHFIIMAGYWLGKFAFDLKDADKISNNITDPETFEIIDSHTDLCTYMHHSIPYLLVVSQICDQACISNTCVADARCLVEYNNANLLYTYYWLYAWAICIYIPWRLYTKDSVYSILDHTQTPSLYIIGFIAFIHGLVYVSNFVGYGLCISITNFSL